MLRLRHILVILFLGLSVITLVSILPSAEAIDYHPIPAVKVKSVPTESDFQSMSKNELLGNYDHAVLTKENGNHTEAYFLYTSGSQIKPVIIFYFEDKTDVELQDIYDDDYNLVYSALFNSDYLYLYFKTKITGEDERFVYAERHAQSGCIIPIEYSNDFLTGKYSGCLGGVTKTKKTEDGWAVYVRFFDVLSPPTTENPYYVKWHYRDFEEVDKDGYLKEVSYFNWPTNLRGHGTVFPIEDKLKDTSVNSGKISVNEFVYKPSDILTQGLIANEFPCADDTITLSSDQEYFSKKDVAVFIGKIKSTVFPVTVYLKIYDANGNIVVQKSTTYSGNNDAKYLVDLKNFEGGLYFASVRFGINGPTDEFVFRLGTEPIPEELLEQKCYFYTMYDSSSKKLSLMVNVDDASHSWRDKIQIFVDKNGNGGRELQSDDITFVVDKNRFGGSKFESDRGWLVGENNEEPANTRLNQLYGKYQVLITVPDVSSNFRIALDNTDYNNFEVKKSRFPPNSFATIPDTWSKGVMNGIQKVSLASDKWIPDEIILNQNLDVNLILVGDDWDSTLQNKIKNLLEKTYEPIIHSELGKAGIKYNFKYNFISLDAQKSQGVFDFMKQDAQEILPFYGEDDYDNPRGIALWIKNNHTEWMNKIQQRFEIDYKLIDAEKMEDYLYDNIISQDVNLKKPGSANLIFISDDPDQVDFLHNYKVKRNDSAQDHTFEAVGLMGYGGPHNLYYFDLYAYPWSDYQGFEFSYDYEMKNHYTNYHDIETEDGRAELISNYVNNATSLLITPSYLYPPVFKSNYVLDLLIVADPGSTAAIGTLQHYFVNVEKIKSELEGLTPWSNWEIKVTVEDLRSRELPQNLKDVLKVPPTELYDFTEPRLVRIVDSEEVTKVVTQWATTKTSSGLKDYQDVQKSSWTIPVVIVIGERGAPVYIDFVGGLGLAPSYPDNPTQPCCALGVSYDNAVWDDKISVTDLTIHEVGHTLSLMHSFVGYDVEGKRFSNHYFDWYLSPMTYGSPLHGCGFWYSYYSEGRCGIIDTEFTKFEKNHLYKGIAVYLMKAAESNSYRALVNLEKEGKDPTNPPTELNNSLEKINTDLADARSSFLINNLLSKDGAIKKAYAAALESEKLAKEYGVSYEPEDQPPQVELHIPEWIKDNAGWWANDAISESDFINALQYLIKERIIVIPGLVESGEGSGQAVPEWVKSNAGWWADGTISDNEFVSAIQYLVEQGIIRVN